MGGCPSVQSRLLQESLQVVSVDSRAQLMSLPPSIHHSSQSSNFGVLPHGKVDESLKKMSSP